MAAAAALIQPAAPLAKRGGRDASGVAPVGRIASLAAARRPARLLTLGNLSLLHSLLPEAGGERATVSLQATQAALRSARRSGL